MPVKQSGVADLPRQSGREFADAPGRRAASSRELRIRLLGPFQIATGGRSLCGPVVRKAQELLALLLLAPQRSVRREVAADALWPSSGPEVTKKAMRQALWQIHQATDAAIPRRLRLVLAEGETIWVNPARTLWLDVATFTEAARRAQSASADAFSPSDFGDFTRAADLYRGSLLTGCYENWCLVKRAHLEDLHITLLDKLSTGHERRGELEPAIRWAQRLLEVEPAHERSHRRLMHLYYRTDDRTRALRQYRRCQWLLQDELGVRPSPRTEQLATAIAGSPTAPGSPASPSDPVPPPVDVDVLDGVRAELLALRTSLEAISAQLAAKLRD